MNRVLLVNMPFFATHCPSIGLGLLKAAVAREGVGCDVRYLNLAFAAYLRRHLPGVHEPYEFVRRRFSLLGDWIFSHELFGERGRLSLEAFLEQYARYLAAPGSLSTHDLAALADTVLAVKDQASPFLEACTDSIDWSRYAVVGFSLMFNQNVASLALARRVKAVRPETAIVFGGASCEEKMGAALHRLFPFVDVVCSGEGDAVFPELVSRVLGGRALDDIPGILYRSGTESRSNLGIPVPEVDVNRLPYPDYDDFLEQWRADPPHAVAGPALLFETSRGCWWGQKSHCTFCSLNGTHMQYRSKSPGRALEEIVHLSERYGIRQLEAVDNILNMSYFRDLLPELKKRQLNLQLYFETKANLSKDKVVLLKEAGVDRISPGIESLSTAHLRLLRKGSTALQNVQLLKWARQFGLWLEWNMLIGIPGEDPAEYPKMAELIRSIPHLQPPWGCTFIRLDRFSPYFERPDAYGIRNVRPLEVYGYVYPFDDATLSELVYYFRYDFADGRDPRLYVQPVVDAVERWKTFEGASLTSSSSGDCLVIHDGRPGFPLRDIALRGIPRTIYEFCDQARPRHAIAAAAGQGDVDEHLQGLVDQKLLLREGDSYLSLAVPSDGG